MKNKSQEKSKEIFSVADYLHEVENILSKLKKKTGSTLFCYRGEDRKENDDGEPYLHSMPNIFRPNIFNDFDRYKWFEKNILDEIKANKISNNSNYLELAMDAQHGGFPSRLLDVTFNSLIALFFAVTPHYTKKKDQHDKFDGRVIIYAVDKMSTSNTESIIDIYDNLVNNKTHNTRLDSYFHILIDFVDLNSRIKAQQGGFILFGGNQYVPIPDSRLIEITIPQASKDTLRKQLDLFFGINMGMIYPEPDNKVEYITNRALKVENEIDYYSIIYNEIEFNIKYMVNNIKFQLAHNENQLTELMVDLSKYIYYIYLSISVYDSSRKDDIDKVEKLKKFLDSKILYINHEFRDKVDGNLINTKNIKFI